MYGLLMVVMTSWTQDVFVKERVEGAAVYSRRCPPIACAFTVRLGGLLDELRFPPVFLPTNGDTRSSLRRQGFVSR